jgi:transitional endoplasmic reticulum ATPase
MQQQTNHKTAPQQIQKSYFQDSLLPTVMYVALVATYPVVFLPIATAKIVKRFPNCTITSLFFAFLVLMYVTALPILLIFTQYTTADLLLAPIKLLTVSHIPLYGSYFVSFLATLILFAYFQFHRKERDAMLKKQDKQAEIKANNDNLGIVTPKITFNDMVGMNETKDRIFKAGQRILSKESNDKRNGILLFGPGGTGKTTFAEALAGSLGLNFMPFNFSQANSMWIGQTTERVTKVFNDAIANAPIVLFLDEVESIFVDRSKVLQADGETARLTAALLPLIEKARNSGVVLVAATNLLDKLDPASIREGRFDFKIEVGYPDVEARTAIIQNALTKFNITTDEATLKRVAGRWNDYAIPRLQGAVAEIKDAGVTNATFDDFMDAMRKVQGRKGESSLNKNKLSDLTMNEEQAKTLNALAWRLDNVHEIESLGGTLPSGVLFYGPPGTGKTFTARALANTAGWGFISTNGHEITSKDSKIDDILAEANDIRPCIVFIDEADDVFGHRQGGFGSAITNKLLSVMDGAKGKNPDVIFIAATNHPDNFDPAALRGGRFTEKVLFELPNETAIETWLNSFFAAKNKITLAMPIAEIANRLVGLSIANVQATAQGAINQALSDQRTTLTEADFTTAIDMLYV